MLESKCFGYVYLLFQKGEGNKPVTAELFLFYILLSQIVSIVVLNQVVWGYMCRAGGVALQVQVRYPVHLFFSCRLCFSSGLPAFRTIKLQGSLPATHLMTSGRVSINKKEMRFSF